MMILATILKKKAFWIILAVLIAVIILYFLFRGKKTVLSNIPDDNQPGENKGLTDQEKENVKQLATALYNELKGLNWGFLWRDPKVFNDLAIASDRITVGAYNYFNENFGNGQTLLSWLKSDWYFSTSNAGHSYKLIMEKFNRLKLI